MSKHIGFITSWMQNEEVDTEIQKFNIAPNNAMEVPQGIQAAQIECRTRIAMVETLMTAPNFANATPDTKKEILDEYKWLIVVDSLF